MTVILLHSAAMHMDRLVTRQRPVHKIVARSSRLIHLALFAISAMISSCGVGAYEERLERTQERLQELEREDSLLGEPVMLPVGQGPDLFLRPPRGVASAPSNTGSPAPDWLYRCPWSDSQSLVPPLQLLVGVHRRTEQRDELDAIITSDLKPNGSPLQRVTDAATGRDVVVTQFSAPPEKRSSVRYRRFVLQSEETPSWPGLKRVALPAPCVYRYEVFVHEAGDWCVVVIFQQLDRDATERLWKSRGAEPAEIRRLPAPERKEVAEQRDCCLATLRVGAAARARWTAWRGE